MARKSYVQHPETGELIERHLYVPPNEIHSAYVMGDKLFQDLTPATDGTAIDSRTKHREYMKSRGLALADDFKGTWSKAEQQRAEFYRGNDRTRRADVERAIHQTVERSRG